MIGLLHNIESGEIWSNEDTRTAELKLRFVMENDLAGIALWELGDDIRDGIDSIVDTIAHVLNEY